jgi:hypothetical protein
MKTDLSFLYFISTGFYLWLTENPFVNWLISYYNDIHDYNCFSCRRWITSDGIQ